MAKPNNIFIKTAKDISWLAVRRIAELGIVWPFVFAYRMIIKEVKRTDGKVNTGKPTILALSEYRFRKDLEILTDSGEFRIFKISSKPVGWIVSLFLTREIQREEHFAHDRDASIVRIQDKLIWFLEIFLSLLYRKLGVDCVISASAYYTNDFYWGLASENIGIPYIVMHRENLVASPNAYSTHFDIAKTIGRFRGSQIIVHNSAMKDIFVNAGYVRPEAISVLGCLRMDNFINMIKGRKSTGCARRKRVILFSFQHGVGISDRMSAWSKDGRTGFVRLFEDVHASIARLAAEHPEIDFVIKPKWEGDWSERIIAACEKNGVDVRSLENFKIERETADAHNLILESDVVCGFGSTTLLEAAIALKPVIIPHFDEALMPEYTDTILLKDHFDLFDVASNPDDMERVILKRLDNGTIDQQCIAGRYRLFEKYVSSTKGDALEKYIEVIKKVIHEKSASSRSAIGEKR